MRDYIDSCVSCGLPCTHKCAYYGKTDTILICDECGDKPDDLFLVEGQELCKECAWEKLKEEFYEKYSTEIEEVVKEAFADEINDFLFDCRIEGD